MSHLAQSTKEPTTFVISKRRVRVCERVRNTCPVEYLVFSARPNFFGRLLALDQLYNAQARKLYFIYLVSIS